jgi:hypothetical protein
MPMTVSDGVWKTEGIILAAGQHVMKFANTSGWTGKDWGSASGMSGVVSETTGGGSNLVFNLSVPGEYAITFNDWTLEYRIICTVPQTANNLMYIGGTINGWWPGNTPMTAYEGGWKAQGIYLQAGAHAIKFANTSDWTGKDWGSASGLNGVVTETTGGGTNLDFNVNFSGEFDISFNDWTLGYAITQSSLKATQSSIQMKGKELPMVFPNPAKDYVEIINLLEGSVVELFDAQGNKVMEFEMVNNHHRFSVSELNAGLYFLKISGNENFIKKIIVQQ